MHVKLKKKYGQNFLIDENIANKIVSLIRNRNLKNTRNWSWGWQINK